MSIYLALQPGVYREWLIALFPPIHRDLVRDVLRDLADALRSYIVGQLLAMTVLAALTAAGLYLLDVPYWLTFGIFTGLVAVIPFFGTLVSTLLPALFVLGGPGGGTRAIYVLLLGVVIHLIEGNLVAPLVMSKKIDMPPVLTIMAVLVVGKLLGPLGSRGRAAGAGHGDGDRPADPHQPHLRGQGIQEEHARPDFRAARARSRRRCDRAFGPAPRSDQDQRENPAQKDGCLAAQVRLSLTRMLVCEKV